MPRVVVVVVLLAVPENGFMGKGYVLCPPVWPKNKQTSDAIFSVINDIKLKEMAPRMW